MSPAFLTELSRLENVVTIKQSSDNFFDVMELIRLTKNQIGFHVTNGQEMWAFPALLLGAQACYGISPLLLGRECIAMYDAAISSDVDKGRAIQLRISIIRHALGKCDATPAACVRELCNMRGLPGRFARDPITELSDRDKAILAEAVQQAEIQSV